MSSVSTTSRKKSYTYTDLSSTQPSTAPASGTNPQTLQLTYHTGDIFSAPPHTLLIHACNTQGHWGAGIAKAFKTLYPKAYKVHHAFCAKEHDKTNPVPTGTAQLIAPVDSGYGEEGKKGKKKEEDEGEAKDEGHWIGCLFTSAKYGKAKDKPVQILKNTGVAMEMLLEMIKMADEEGTEGVGTIRMCKINSGKFGVPWEKTEGVLKGIMVKEGWRGTIEVWEPVEQ